MKVVNRAAKVERAGRMQGSIAIEDFSIVDDAGEDSESDNEMSSVGSYDSGDDEEPAGNMDEI